MIRLLISKPTAAWILAILAVGVMCRPSATLADDWPQFLGPERDGVWRETIQLPESFSSQNVRPVWSAEIAGGYAGPAVADGRVFVTDYLRQSGDATPNADERSLLQGTERVLCFSAVDGKLLWKYEYPRAYNISYPAGPRATPTVDGDRVYVLGAEGDLICLRVDSGEVVWRRFLPADYDCKPPIWGYAAHPLVDGNRLICLAGGEGSVAVALDKETGREIWRSLDAPSIGYSPPMKFSAGGVSQLLIWHPKALNGLNPETGEIYWSEPLSPDYEMSIAPPIASGSRVYVGAIKNKSMAVELQPERPAVKEVAWVGKNNIGLGPSHSHAILDADDPNFVYGIDGRGDLKCVDLRTGETQWATFDLMANRRNSSSGSAFLTRLGDTSQFLILSETAELVLAELTPEKFVEKGRTDPLVELTHDAFGRAVLWSPPAFSDGKIFVRNDKKLLCAELVP